MSDTWSVLGFVIVYPMQQLAVQWFPSCCRLDVLVDVSLGEFRNVAQGIEITWPSNQDLSVLAILERPPAS